eukprot:Em0018g1076a
MELFVHSGDETIASVEPESLQILTYLHLSEIPKNELTVTTSCLPWKSPTSEYPVLREGSVIISGSEAIILYLKEHLYLQWLETQNYVEVTRKWYGKVLYFPLSIFIPTWKHNTWQRRLMEDTPQDYVQQKGIELLKRAEDGITCLSSRLGEKDYFFGNNPSSLDALVFGCLEVIIQQWSSENNSLARQLHACTNLKQFCNRIHQNCFPALKPRALQVVTPTPSKPLWKDPALWLWVFAAAGILCLQGALLFGDFTKDEVAQLLTEKQKGIEFICQGRRKGVVAQKNKTEVFGINGTTATKNFASESTPAGSVVPSAGGSSPPPSETGDQSKNPSRLNANAPAFVPGRADYGASDRDSYSLVPNIPPEEQREATNPVGQWAPSTPQSSALPPTNIISATPGASVVVVVVVDTRPQPSVGPCCSPSMDTVQPQAMIAGTTGHCHTTPTPVIPSSGSQVPADREASSQCVVTLAANSGAKDTTVSAACTRTVQPSLQKSWASIVVRKAPMVPSGGIGTAPSSCAASGGLATSVQGSRTGSSEGTKVPKGGGVAGPGENSVAGNGFQVPRVNSTSAQAQLRNLGEQLQQISISYDAPSVIPRGLTNVGNWCYVHAPLQALLALPGFYQLLKILNPYPALTKGCSATPITDSMIQFFHEFASSPKSADNPDGDVHKAKRVTSKGDLIRGDSFKPDYIYQMLQEIKSNFSFKGRQEDAEEFLGCVLDGLHEEMVAARQAVAAVGSEMGNKESDVTQHVGEDDGDEWEHVGPKNKSSILRKASYLCVAVVMAYMLVCVVGLENACVQMDGQARLNKRPSNIDTMKPTKRTRSAIEEAANKEFQSLSEFLPNLPDTDARTLALRMYYLELSESVSPSDAQASQSEQHVFNQLMYSKEVSGRLSRNSLKDWNSLLAASSIRAAEFPLGLRRALRSFQVDAADLLAALCDRPTI